MKYCGECGNQLENEAEFCYSCGAPCPDVTEEELYLDRLTAYRREVRQRERNKGRQGSKGKKGLIVLLCLLAALLIYVCFCPGRRCFQLALDGKAEEAGSLYENSVKGKLMEGFIARCLVPAGAETVLKAWQNGKLSYEEAGKRLDMLVRIEEPLNNAARAKEALTSAGRSEQAFEMAVKSEASGDLRSAALSYRAVGPEDSRYAEAVKKAAEMEDNYKAMVLSSIGEPGTAEASLAAMNALDEALAVLPEDESLLAARAAVKDRYAEQVKAETIPIVKDYIAKGYYREAIQITEQLLRVNEQDVELKALLARAVTDYEEFARSQVQIYLANEDKAGAADFLERIRPDLPEDPVLAQLTDLLN